MQNNALDSYVTPDHIICEQRRHILALKREVRLLNRALGRKTRKVDRLRQRLDLTAKMVDANIAIMHVRGGK